MVLHFLHYSSVLLRQNKFRLYEAARTGHPYIKLPCYKMNPMSLLLPL